jgi:hypothetical protein
MIDVAVKGARLTKVEGPLPNGVTLDNAKVTVSIDYPVGNKTLYFEISQDKMGIHIRSYTRTTFGDEGDADDDDANVWMKYLDIVRQEVKIKLPKDGITICDDEFVDNRTQ